MRTNPFASLWAPVAAMTVVVAASNWLVQFPINDVLTWGAITYPFSFLITDLTTRLHGPVRARRMVVAGFAVAVLLFKAARRAWTLVRERYGRGFGRAQPP